MFGHTNLKMQWQFYFELREHCIDGERTVVTPITSVNRGALNYRGNGRGRGRGNGIFRRPRNRTQRDATCRDYNRDGRCKYQNRPGGCKYTHSCGGDHPRSQCNGGTKVEK